MANTFISNLAARNMADEITALLDAGAGGALIRIYDGVQPADADETPANGGASVLLAELTCSVTSFAAAGDAAPGGIITANAITDDTSANATGTATWFRAVTSSATANATGIIDGDVGTTGASDMQLNSTNISSGATVSITAWTITVPES